MNEILNKINKAKKLCPKELLADKGLNSDGIPIWHSFEYKVWELGEQIRQDLLENQKFKKDKNLQKEIMEVIELEKLRRGRQSFVMLLGNTSSSSFHERISAFLEDKDINGHVLKTLLKMKAYQYAEKVKSLETSEHAWVRKTAKHYINKSKECNK